MKHLMLGIVLGSLLTSGLGLAASFYDKQGNVKAPAGSQQSFDYFRQRGAYLDLQALRRPGHPL